MMYTGSRVILHVHTLLKLHQFQYKVSVQNIQFQPFLTYSTIKHVQMKLTL